MPPKRPNAVAAVAAAIAGTIAAASPAAAQGRDWTKVEIKTQKLAEGIYALEGAGGNLGLCAGPDGAFLVDDQFAQLTPKIKAAIAAVTDKPVRFVLNTHYHGDHVGGNVNLGTDGAVIVAQDNVRIVGDAPDVLADRLRRRHKTVRRKAS